MLSSAASAENAATSAPAVPEKPPQTPFMQRIRQIMPAFMKKSTVGTPAKTPNQANEELIVELQNQLTFKTGEIATLQTELNRYQTVLDRKSAERGDRSHELDCIRQDELPRQRAIGVSAEPESTKMGADEKLKKYSKSARYVQNTFGFNSINSIYGSSCMVAEKDKRPL
ncbi:unnamed protein product [Dibothriocephalus latus]|uniref:Uncharacterized protein n=1 Tax=Dibothriocephalus latus TaxID=60516 RepID=A0A3P7LGM2_DIBLA|nr:unnamed protein product [Dibothriocephalus latus]